MEQVHFQEGQDTDKGHALGASVGRAQQPRTNAQLLKDQKGRVTSKPRPSKVKRVPPPRDSGQATSSRGRRWGGADQQGSGVMSKVTSYIITTFYPLQLRTCRNSAGTV